MLRLAFLTLLIIFPLEVISQTYDKIIIGVGHSSSYNLSDRYKNNWKFESYYLNSFSIATPYKFGEFELSATILDQKNKQDLITEASTRNLILSIFIEASISDWWSLSFAPTIGAQETDIKNVEGITNTREREVLLGASIRNSIHIGNMNLYTKVTYLTAFYYYRQQQYSIDVGVSYSIDLSKQVRGWID